MLEVYYSAQFRRDYKQMQKQGKDMEALLDVVDILARQEPLDAVFHDHKLSGKLKGYRECHIQPDWLLIYKIDSGRLLLTLTRTGTHGELFGK